MSELLFNEPAGSIELINAYYDGACGAIRLYAHWKDGVQYVGTCGRTLQNALDDLEKMRQRAFDGVMPQS